MPVIQSYTAFDRCQLWCIGLSLALSYHQHGAIKDAVFTSDAPGVPFDRAVGAEERQASLRRLDREDYQTEKRQGKGGHEGSGSLVK